jgi:ubiquinone/menaquinone biosynthesis C-methylase UbiE
MGTDQYSVIANEYYDALLHPTCANFDELSRRYLECRIAEQLFEDRAILEVGAGKSVVADVVRRSRSSVKLTLLDSSKEMLALSRKSAGFAEFIVADAKSTGLPEASFDLIVSSLGDPYNTNEFWHEISRLLRPQGVCLFTTPAPEWALAFRDESHLREAEFVLSDGRIIFVPSFVVTYNEQIALIERARLNIESTEEFCVSDLTGFISPKLKANMRKDNPVVLRGFQVRKAVDI